MEKGLTQKEAETKLITLGKNELSGNGSFSPISLFTDQFPSLINGILFLAAVFSFAISDFLDGIFILAIIILGALFGFFQEYKAEKSFEALKKIITPLCRVFRDGKEIQILTSQLVPGDVVHLTEGERIPADGKIISETSFEIDESILTGESLPVIKGENHSIFSGTLIIKGGGKILVEKTGTDTHFGQIAKLLKTVESDKTPLQIQVDALGKTLSFIAIATAGLLLPIGIFYHKEFLPMIVLAISIAIAAIPESLPAVVTIALALGANRMAKKKAIIRKIGAVETLGAVQVILTDKTGTLTQNHMKVKKFWTPSKSLLPDLLRACVLGNTASLIERANENSFDVVGDKTDGALLLFAKDQNADIENLKMEGKILEENPFDQTSKTITTTWEKNKKRHNFIRGACETFVQDSSLSKDKKIEITKLAESYAKEGLRVIAVGQNSSNQKHIELLGIFGIYDPPRPEVKQALLEAKRAGIKTIMVTGDNELTALTIAKEIGLIERNEDVINGQELEELSDEGLIKIIDKVRIFARVKPQDKLRLVNIFKHLGYVVGITGDGVNDALALKRADVGLAMGEDGTDVARQASDIILTDDNYSTLIHAVEEGRNIYNNILKAITYLVASNLSEISFIVFTTLLGLPNPLLPTQILWINLVTDGLPALALASDTKDPYALAKKPRLLNSPILSNHRRIFILFAGFGLALFFIATFKILLGVYSENAARTIIFNILIFSHMILAFVVRGKSMFKMNKFLIIGVTLTLILQIIITFNPFFQDLFHLALN